MTERDFETQLDLDPSRWDVRSVFADWLDEQGEDMRAAGQRWQAECRKAAMKREPGPTPHVGKCLWWSAPHEGDRRPYAIPAPLFCAMTLYPRGGLGRGNQYHGGKRVLWFRFRVQAELCLARGLNELRALLGERQATLF